MAKCVVGTRVRVGREFAWDSYLYFVRLWIGKRNVGEFCTSNGDWGYGKKSHAIRLAKKRAKQLSVPWDIEDGVE